MYMYSVLVAWISVTKQLHYALQTLLFAVDTSS